jgi:hypothetical protein
MKANRPQTHSTKKIEKTPQISIGTIRYLSSFFKPKFNAVLERDVPESILFQQIQETHDGLNVFSHNVGVDLVVFSSAWPILFCTTHHAGRPHDSF